MANVQGITPEVQWIGLWRHDWITTALPILHSGPRKEVTSLNRCQKELPTDVHSSKSGRYRRIRSCWQYDSQLASNRGERTHEQQMAYSSTGHKANSAVYGNPYGQSWRSNRQVEPEDGTWTLRSSKTVLRGSPERTWRSIRVQGQASCNCSNHEANRKTGFNTYPRTDSHWVSWFAAQADYRGENHDRADSCRRPNRRSWHLTRDFVLGIRPQITYSLVSVVPEQLRPRAPFRKHYCTVPISTSAEDLLRRFDHNDPRYGHTNRFIRP